MSKHYRGELSDKEWELIEPIFVRQHIKNGGRKNAGRKPKYGARVILNAIFYILRAGCAWHLLPHDFPPWQTVYSQFQSWQRRGIFIQLHDYVKGKLRPLLGKAREASAGIIDSQSVKTTEKGGCVGTMLGRKSKVEKGILPSIRKGFCYRRMLRVGT
jgi:putative transposase